VGVFPFVERILVFTRRSLHPLATLHLHSLTQSSTVHIHPNIFECNFSSPWPWPLDLTLPPLSLSIHMTIVVMDWSLSCVMIICTYCTHRRPSAVDTAQLSSAHVVWNWAFIRSHIFLHCT
jgi:hypothetical protein